MKYIKKKINLKINNYNDRVILMKILSFDVGIKNLAYCYLETHNNNYSILEWDVINICKDNQYNCVEKRKIRRSV